MIVHMTAKGLFSIPQAIRRKLGITARTRVCMNVDDQTRKIVLTPITREYVKVLRGKYKGKGLLKALAAEKKR